MSKSNDLNVLLDMLKREFQQNNPDLLVPDFVGMAHSLKEFREGKYQTVDQILEELG